MGQRIGMDASKVAGHSKRPPRLVLIAGTTGVGKSTVAVQAAAKLGFTRIVSTDAIREVLRSTDPQHEIPRLHRSSFARGEAGDPVLDWRDSCTVVEVGIEASIARARREGIDLLVEGVHLVPDNRWLNEWRESGGLAIGFIMKVDIEEQHLSMLKERDANSWRRADRYIAAFERIRAIQSGLEDLSVMRGWQTMDPSQVADPVDRIAHWIDLEWNEYHRNKR